MTNKKTGFALLPADELRRLAIKGGKKSKGRTLSEEHKQRLRESYLRNQAKKKGGK